MYLLAGPKKDNAMDGVVYDILRAQYVENYRVTAIDVIDTMEGIPSRSA